MPWLTEQRNWQYRKVTCGEIAANMDKFKDLDYLDPMDKAAGVRPFRIDGKDSLYWVQMQNPRKILLVCEYKDTGIKIGRV